MILKIILVKFKEWFEEKPQNAQPLQARCNRINT